MLSVDLMSDGVGKSVLRAHFSSATEFPPQCIFLHSTFVEHLSYVWKRLVVENFDTLRCNLGEEALGRPTDVSGLVSFKSKDVGHFFFSLKSPVLILFIFFNFIFF